MVFVNASNIRDSQILKAVIVKKPDFFLVKKEL
jgi:hypothetical protein